MVVVSQKLDETILNALWGAHNPLRADDHRNPRNRPRAISTDRSVAASPRPMDGPTFSRGTVTALSIITCDSAGSPFLRLGRIVIRNSGQSCSSLVSGRTVTDARA